MRIAPSGILGWDMTAALALGRALGVNARAVAELLPDVEAAMVRKLNEQIKAGAPRDEH